MSRLGLPDSHSLSESVVPIEGGSETVRVQGDGDITDLGDSDSLNFDVGNVGDIMDILADLYVSLGDAQTGSKIRDGKLFTERITVGDIIMNNFC